MNEILGGGFGRGCFRTFAPSRDWPTTSVVASVWLGISVALQSRDVDQEPDDGKSITALFEQVQGMLMNPPTPDELQKAKDAILKSRLSSFDSKAKILSDRDASGICRLSRRLHREVRRSDSKVTLEDVKRVAQKYLNPGGFAVLVVGNPDEIGDQLTQLKHLGPVQTVDITIPPPPPRQNPAQK